MGYTKPIPVERENIQVGNKYYTCNYSGAIAVTIVKIFDDTESVLVSVKSKRCKPFVRPMKYIFDNSFMANYARRDWEHDRRKQKKSKKKQK